MPFGVVVVPLDVGAKVWPVCRAIGDVARPRVALGTGRGKVGAGMTLG
jgi:hypothetical protein